MSTKVPALIIAAAVITIAVITYDKLLPFVRGDYAPINDPKPVDFSFSLDCRMLAGRPNEPLAISIEEYEKTSTEAEKTNNWMPPINNPLTQGLIYEKHARVAYNHGKVDGGAISWLADTFVTEVTPEIIVVEGRPTSIGPLIYGTFDRRTGSGSLSSYTISRPIDGKPDKGEWSNVTRNLWKQYEFQCEPAPHAKF